MGSPFPSIASIVLDKFSQSEHIHVTSTQIKNQYSIMLEKLEAVS